MKPILITLGVILAIAIPGAGSTALSAGLAAPTAPAGVTGMAAEASVQLAWQPVAGASAYTVYRGTSATSITTMVTPAGGVTATSYTDTTATNGTTYYYAVRSVASGAESSNSLVVQAKPVARTCVATNPTVQENCHAGDAGWRVTDPGNVSSGGIEGYAAVQSLNKGESVNLMVNSGTAPSFQVQIYRSGYYGGAGARLFSIIRNVPGTSQPACNSDSTTGLVDCANWATSATITTTSSWPSGVYIVRIVRTDNASDSEILLVVRDDARHSDALYGVSMATYEAYNNYGGKSLYEYNSLGDTTIAGTVRAVKVSFDRPFEQPRSGANTDWYDKTDYPFVYWLEKSGYDITYISDTDLDQQPSLLLTHKLYISGSHAEYVSAGMRTAMTQARDAKVNLFFSGSNTDYWKIRFEASPTTSRAGRTLVCYKTTAGGPVDPQGPTGLWRDKAGANLPENALIGQQYTGDDDFSTYPMIVNTTQGKDRVWRYTDLATLAPGDSMSFPGIVGWEWDARANNGSEPPGVVTLASSPVSGNIFTSPPYNFAQGNATVTMTKYLAPSGALVVATGTNDWDRALALNAEGAGQIQWTSSRRRRTSSPTWERTRPRLPPTSCSTRRERRR